MIKLLLLMLPAVAMAYSDSAEEFLRDFGDSKNNYEFCIKTCKGLRVDCSVFDSKSEREECEREDRQEYRQCVLDCK